MFDHWGIHIYIGRFGKGKTSAMVHDAYNLCMRYKQVSILTNLQLYNFPMWTNIIPLKNIDDIKNAPNNTIVMIDEIGTIFNSRSFLNRKTNKKTGETKAGGVPFIVFQHLCQVRKNHIILFATAQRFQFVDKQIRDVTDTVRVCNSYFKHPFTRLQTVRLYDGWEYGKLLENPSLPYDYFNSRVFIQTNRLRKSYNTAQLIETIIDDDYLDDDEINQKRSGNASINIIDKKS